MRFPDVLDSCRRLIPHVGIALACVLVHAGGADAMTREERAKDLFDRAQERVGSDRIEYRRQAISWLEQATLLEPENPDYQMALGHAYYAAGFYQNARLRFEKVAELLPSDPDAQFGMGEVWRKDYLKYLDRKSLDRAIDAFTSSAARRPDHADSWLQLVPLQYEKHNLPAAAAAAMRAAEAAPDRAEAQLAVAYTAFHRGDLDTAAESFARAIDGLHPEAQRCFMDIGPIATEADTTRLGELSPPAQREFIRRFWKEYDPDPTTRQNEARLEYWARVAQAYFLYFDAKRGAWDIRGEVYVRYGPPEVAAYNPLGVNLTVRMGTIGSFPANMLVWYYPSLGMIVPMQDRLLTENYMLPLRVYSDPDPRPAPVLVGDEYGNMATREGRAVFHTLPPGSRPLETRGLVSRFEARAETRLLGQMEVPGTPAARLRATWVVLDSTQREVARASRSLAPSACDPADLRVADFAAELPPGEYTVGLSVSDGEGGRGVYRTTTEILDRRPGVRLSDIVIACGRPDRGSAVVRPEPNPGARVIGNGPLTAYFEIYDLRLDERGTARFEYVYTVRSVERDDRIWISRVFRPTRTVPPIRASRIEEHRGSLRRQYVTIPVTSLPPGPYELEVEVRDLTNGVAVINRAVFERY